MNYKVVCIHCAQVPLLTCVSTLKGPIHDQKICQYIKAKNWHQNFEWIFDRVWEIFFCQKIHWLKILTDKKKYVRYILTTLQHFDSFVGSCQNFDQNSVLRWTYSQNQNYGNGSIRIIYFQHNEFWTKFWWNVCGLYGVKNLIKNWTSIFCFKILIVFLIVYGAL